MSQHDQALLTEGRAPRASTTAAAERRTAPKPPRAERVLRAL
jgi:hypothetical protein